MAADADADARELLKHLRRTGEGYVDTRKPSALHLRSTNDNVDILKNLQNHVQNFKYILKNVILMVLV